MKLMGEDFNNGDYLGPAHILSAAYGFGCDDRDGAANERVTAPRAMGKRTARSIEADAYATLATARPLLSSVPAAARALLERLR